MRMRLMSVARLAFAVLAAYTLGYACNRASTSPSGVGTVNFFSFFTILSNVSAVVVLLAGGLAGLFAPAGRRRVPGGIRGAVTVYMVVTGIIYALVLSADQTGQLPVWIDDVVHQIMPIVVFVDWLADPPARRLSFRIIPYWLVFPAAFTAYSLIRGPIVRWYPYPFLDPRKHGYGHVVAESVPIAVAVVAICFLIVWLGNAVGPMLGRRLD